MRERGRQAVAEFDLEAFLPYELSVVSNRVSRTFARRYADVVTENADTSALNSKQPRHQ